MTESMLLYKILMYAHLLTVIPCVFLGLFIFLSKKGTRLHKTVGRIYMYLMFTTAIIALFLPAFVGPSLFGHFGFIHLFCVLVIYSVPTSILAAKRGQIKKHKVKVISMYVGALLIAGAFTFMPGRFMYELFFGV